MKTKNYKADWILKNCNKEDEKNRMEVKNFDVKLGRNVTKWQLRVIFNKETDSLEVYLLKKKANSDNFHISFSIKIGRDEFQWEKKAMEIENGAWGWPALMRLDVLFDDSKGYVDNSKRMKLGIEMKLTELDEISTQLDSTLSTQAQACYTCSYYFENPAYSDFTLICDDGVSLPVHRVFIAKKSPVFKKHFETISQEQNSIALKEISSGTMKEVLRFIYCGYADIKDVILITNVLHAAAQYEIADLIAMCIEELMEQVNKDNVMAILDIAFVYGHQELEQKCTGVILKYYKELKDTDTWNSMKMPVIMKIMDAALNTAKHLGYQT